MSKKQLILLLMFLSWPVQNLHRLWRDKEVVVRWFADKELWDYRQWYFYHVFDYLSYILIFFALWVYINSNMKRDRDVLCMFGAIMVNQVIDLPHYMLLRRTSSLVLLMQSVIMLLCSLNILLKQRR